MLTPDIGGGMDEVKDGKVVIGQEGLDIVDRVGGEDADADSSGLNMLQNISQALNGFQALDVFLEFPFGPSDDRGDFEHRNVEMTDHLPDGFVLQVFDVFREDQGVAKFIGQAVADLDNIVMGVGDCAVEIKDECCRVFVHRCRYYSEKIKKRKMGSSMNGRDLSGSYFREIRELYEFAAEKVREGLFKSEIIERLIELGVDRMLAFDVLEEMQRCLSGLRQRRVILAFSGSPFREHLFQELRFQGYQAVCEDDLARLEDGLVSAVPDLVIADACDREIKGRDVVRMLRAHIVGRRIPVFIKIGEGLCDTDFQQWEHLLCLDSRWTYADIALAARDVFLRKIMGDADDA